MQIFSLMGDVSFRRKKILKVKLVNFEETIWALKENLFQQFSVMRNVIDLKQSLFYLNKIFPSGTLSIFFGLFRLFF